MLNFEKIAKKIKENDIKFVDLQFTTLQGSIRHITINASDLSEENFTTGIMFDGSSIPGWKAINESDMILKPDIDTMRTNAFTTHPTVIFTCDILNPRSREPYNRDPRHIARKAESWLKKSQIGNLVYVGPEPEFFIFDNVKYKANPDNLLFKIESNEFSSEENSCYETTNFGHYPKTKEGYCVTPPVDSAHNIRSEMLSVMSEMKIPIEKHHHEVASAQHELGLKFDTLLRMADNMQICKYIVRQVAANYGKTATFMPKPIFNDNGSGMHVHISLWNDSTPLFAGNEHEGLSLTCLHFIGGIIRHAKALNAFTNPLTNSYKRLVPGFEAPVLLAWSCCNRSASCRIPFAAHPKGKRVEIRFPDPGANPYLAFSAILMAGLDGIQNKIDPGAPIEKNLYELSEEERKKIPTVCSSLRQALEELDKDREFLKAGNVFDDDQIHAFIDLKMKEVLRLETTTHPVEFDMYYSI